jgi:mono/diheme cytochrome c family protein
MIRNLLLSGITLLCLAFLFIPGFTQDKPPQTMSASSDVVKRGEYLTTLGACHDCHTPKKMGPKGPELDMSLALVRT